MLDSILRRLYRVLSKPRRLISSLNILCSTLFLSNVLNSFIKMLVVVCELVNPIMDSLILNSLLHLLLLLLLLLVCFV